MLSLRNLAFGLLASVATTTFTVGPAQARDVVCGSDYTVVRGDTLGAIAKDVYGSTQQFRTIYQANTRVIGPNPGLIEVGMRLSIPCLDAPIVASSADTSVLKTEETTGMLPLPDQDTIRFVTATDWAPFTDESDEQGGMAVEIVNVAMAQADGNPDYQIDFINDWGSHLRPLISDHAYDFSLVWFRPNCDIVERLGDGSKFRCNNLAWSEPVIEQILGYYTLSDGITPTTHADLLGTTICRPAGYATFMLEEHNLVEPTATLIRENSPRECFEALLTGRVDAVALAADVAEGAILELNAGDSVQVNEPLSQVLTLHAVISNTHPKVDEYVQTLNSGIIRIKDSGEWFDIVRRHMTAHRAKTQG